MKINGNFLVEKRNVLNEMRSYDMSLQELRLFSIYLSKINSRDIDSRKVVFSLGEFQKIMGYVRINFDNLNLICDSLLSKIIKIPTKDNGFDAFQLFKRFKVAKSENNSWFIEIDAHDDALPLMFEFKDKYFKYKLWNVLNLKSANHLRLYEVLKQYERLRERIFKIDELKELIGLKKEEYIRYNDFKEKILVKCQKALEEHTDIKFEFEPYGEKGRGGKVIKLKFKISENKNYKNPLNLEQFIEEDDTVIDGDLSEIELNIKKAEDYYSKLEELESKFKNKDLFFYSEACKHEFNEKELQVLYNMVFKIVPMNINANMKTEYYDYLKSKYDELNLKASRRSISNRYGYIKKLIKLDYED